MPKYKVGSDDPILTPDQGAGKWNSEDTTWEMRSKKAAIITILSHAYTIVGVDATKHMYHYLGNSGVDHTIDLEGLISVDNERKVFYDELILARKFTETLPEGCHLITSARVIPNAYIRKNESKNWFFAVGGLFSLGKRSCNYYKRW